MEMQPNENQAALKDQEEEEQDEQQVLQQAQQQQLHQAKLQQEQHTRSNGAANSNNRFKSNALKQEKSSSALRKRQEASRTATIAAAAAAIAQITPATHAAAAAAATAGAAGTTTVATSSAKAFNLNDVSSYSNINKRHQATSSSSNNRSSNKATAAATTTAAATVAALPNQSLSCRKTNSQNSPYLATPKTLTTPTRFIAAKTATVTAKPTAPTTSTTTSSPGGRGATPKRVNFNLPSTIAESEQEFEHELDFGDDDDEEEEEISMALAQAKPSGHLSRKPHIVFNGTYPIDMPLMQGQSQLKGNSYDPEANTDRGDLQRYRNYMLHDYVIDEDAEGEEQAEDDEDEYADEDLLTYADDDESFDDGDYYTHELLNKYGIIADKEAGGGGGGGGGRSVERTSASVEAATTSAAQPQHVWSMEELIANPAIPLNYKKMCSEVEHSLSRFENYLDSKKEQQLQQPAAPVRTFDIDAPTRRGHRSRSSSTSANAGLPLRSKKKL